MELACPPHMKRHLHAEVIEIQTRPDAWKWIAGQVHSHLPDPEWLHADLLDDVGAILLRIAQRIGMRRRPSYVHPQMARE